MTSRRLFVRRLFIFTAVCLAGVGVMTMADEGVAARIFQALGFFGAGLCVGQALRPSESRSGL